MRCPCPQLLQRSPAETVCPESAEIVEADAEHDAENKTYAVAADRVETKSPVVEKEAAYDALQQVVGKAHLAYALKTRNGFTHTCGVI